MPRSTQETGPETFFRVSGSFAKAIAIERLGGRLKGS